MSFNGYRLDPSVYDEMFLPDGTPREHARDLHDALSRMSTDELETIRGRVNRTFSSESISFTVYGDSEAEERIIPVDPIPRVVTAADWRQVSDGLTQRVRALNYFLEDVYGEARIIDDGVIPEDMVRAVPNTARKCRTSRRPTAHGSPSAAATWCAPTTASACWRTTCGCPRASLRGCVTMG